MTGQQSIILLGMNHNTASVEVREKFSLATFCEPEAQTFTRHFSSLASEIFIISTCNRVELMVLANQDCTVDALIKTWADMRNASEEELKVHIFIHINEEAIEHLFSVASSLDSLVLGEPQILGQLKQAYRKSVEAKSVGSIFTRLLHKAFSVAKRVRTETSLASSAVSISYAAVELAKQIFDNITKHSVLIIGAGEMAELAALHLKQAGVSNMYVANRTFENAEELAEKIEGKAIAFEEIANYFAEVDIVISSTGAAHTIISAKDIQPLLKVRKYRPMFFIDIAMPRDIDPDVNTLENVYLYDIDDLKEVVEENMQQRRLEAEKALAIVKEEKEGFTKWLTSLEAQPTIVALNERTTSIIQKEFERLYKKYPDMPKEILEEMILLKQSLSKKLNHAPLAYLKNHHSLETSISNIKRIFDI